LIGRGKRWIKARINIIFIVVIKICGFFIRYVVINLTVRLRRCEIHVVYIYVRISTIVSWKVRIFLMAMMMMMVVMVMVMRCIVRWICSCIISWFGLIRISKIQGCSQIGSIHVKIFTLSGRSFHVAMFLLLALFAPSYRTLMKFVNNINQCIVANQA